MTSPVSVDARKGGAWLLGETAAGRTFTPADLSEEHRLVARTAEAFAVNEVLPALERLEQKDWALARALLKQAGDLGLLGTDVPEAYGGVPLDKAASVVIAEAMARSASFGATFGAQVNLSIMPLVCFGTEAQRAKYLPRLVSGDAVGAYCLSESGSGSDALGARARATRTPEGDFVLSGEKMWITNGGFADIFIVFAKVDGEQFTAFIVERAFPGVTSGKEEHKMGLHGSSTTPVILQDVRVPAENLLGEVGKGHKVAFNVLNYGRFKLAAATTGGARAAIGEAARYAAGRRQFGRPIASFGAIKYKLAEMTARTYAVESLLFRTAGFLDAQLAAEGSGAPEGAAVLRALEEFAIEASIAKVAGSEMLDYVLDENIQIHGGNGFVRDYPAERHYRDSRVNRIFEGTNEINRLLIPTMLMRRAGKGGLPPDPLADGAPLPDAGPATPSLRRSVAGCRQATMAALALAARRFGDTLAEQQEVLTWIADLAIDTFAAESALLRAEQAGGAAEASGAPSDLHTAAATVFINDAAARVEINARQAFAAAAPAPDAERAIASLRERLAGATIDTVPLRRALADATVEKGAYLFR